MSTHKPPRGWGRALQDAGRVQRTGGERFTRSAAPVPAVTSAVQRAVASAVGVTQEAHKIEQFVLAANGAQDLTLEFAPVDGSWNVMIRRLSAFDTDDFTIAGQTLSLVNGDLAPKTGDKVRVQYDYLTGQSAAPNTAWVDTVTTLGPLAWYRLDDVSNGGTMLDSSGHGHHGTWNSVATHTLAPSLLPSDPNSALSMTGAGGEGASVSSASWMNLTTNVSWVIFFKGTDTAARLWAREATTGGVQDWSLQAGSQLYFAAGGGIVLTSTASGLNDNHMHMAVYTLGGGNLKLYIDGSLDKNVTYSTALGTTAQDVYIGYGGGLTSSAMFTGTLDEAIWFDKVLTATDVSNLWAAAQ